MVLNFIVKAFSTELGKIKTFNDYDFKSEKHLEKIKEKNFLGKLFETNTDSIRDILSYSLDFKCQ